jgi:hypothetical protein
MTLEWKPGKDSDGKVPMGNGKPIFYVSKCGHYTVCRVSTVRGWASEAWFKALPTAPAIPLLAMTTWTKATQACEEHAHGHSSQATG